MISNITDKYNELYQLTTKIYSSYTSAKFTASDTVEILGKTDMRYLQLCGMNSVC